MIYELRPRDVAEELKRIRKEQLMSLRDVAGQTGISASTISRIENGFVEDASFGAILALCNCYGVTVEELLCVEFEDILPELENRVSLLKGLFIDLYNAQIDPAHRDGILKYIGTRIKEL